MRWKLLFLASVAAAVLGVGLWSLFAIICFGNARDLARHDWILQASALIPLGLTTYAGIFVYRHTARRRKTQAMLTVLFSCLLTPAVYLAACSLLPQRLYIPTSYEVRHAR
jgi:hypothetical protein